MVLTEPDDYEHSTLLAKLNKRKKAKKPLRIAFLDIDSTMTGSHSSTNATRRKLERHGYVIVYVTARTEEMLMSDRQYTLSRKLGFDRPEPHFGRYNGKRVAIAPENTEPLGILDPDIIAGSSGTQILLRQNRGGYFLDKKFESGFSDTPQAWRQKIMSIIHAFNTPQKKAFTALYEQPKNYHEGLTDIFQPKYRIALKFQSVKQKKEFRAFVRQTQLASQPIPDITITDDSEPRKGQYVLYLTPRNGSKTKAVDHIIKMVVGKLDLNRADLHILIAGDGHADFEMGMRSARGACVTFLLPGGSRLMPALRCKDEHPDLFDHELEQLKTFLLASKIKGYYTSRLYANRHMIICDEVYRGKKEVASILPLIEDLENN